MIATICTYCRVYKSECSSVLVVWMLESIWTQDVPVEGDRASYLTWQGLQWKAKSRNLPLFQQNSPLSASNRTRAFADVGRRVWNMHRNTITATNDPSPGKVQVERANRSRATGAFFFRYETVTATPNSSIRSTQPATLQDRAPEQLLLQIAMLLAIMFDL